MRFDGSARQWSVWEIQFLARANWKGFLGVLDGTTPIPTDSTVIDETTAAGKIQAAAKKANALGYEELILSVDTETDEGLAVFQIIRNSRDTDYKNGNCEKAWKALTAKFNGASTTSKVELKKDFNKSEMEKDEDPTVYIARMEGKRARMTSAG